MINCYKFKQNISDYIDGRISFREKQEFDSHKSNCPHCQNLYNSVVQIHTTMTNFKPVSTSEDFMSNLSQKILADRNSRILASQKQGFSFRRLPLFAYAFGTALTAVVVAFVVIQVNKYDDIAVPVLPMADQQMQQQAMPRSVTAPQQMQPRQYLAKQALPAQSDSASKGESGQLQSEPYKIDYSKQIQTVGDRR